MRGWLAQGALRALRPVPRLLAPLLPLVTIPLLVGCELASVNVASPRASIVVHAVLNPDVTEQVILVESSLTGRVAINDSLKFDALDPIRTAGGEPLSGADVRLFAGNDTVGARATETQLRGRGTGRYTIAGTLLPLRPGTRYRLRIRTTDAREVTGETLVPSAGTGWVPGAGTAAQLVTLNRSTDTLRLAWSPVPDARTYAIRVETPNGPWFLFSDSTRFALNGSLRNFFAEGLPSVWYPGFRQTASVVAVDRNFYDYNRSGNDPFGGRGLISSVKGGLGLFGSVLGLLRRDVTVDDRDRSMLDARWVGVSSVSGEPSVELDLWLESPGPAFSSVSGRVRTSFDRYIIGIWRDDNSLRLATLAGIANTDTVALFTGRVAGDSIVGSYDPRFAGGGPRVYRRQQRQRP